MCRFLASLLDSVCFCELDLACVACSAEHSIGSAVCPPLCLLPTPVLASKVCRARNCRQAVRSLATTVFSGLSLCVLPISDHIKVLESLACLVLVVSDLSPVTPNIYLADLCQKIIHPDCDIKFTGNVSWVGKTSMEVKMHMLQVSSCDFSLSYNGHEVLQGEHTTAYSDRTGGNGFNLRELV